MRLWHWKLIHYLPKSQLLGQWRELNSILKKKDKHILINYVYEYDDNDLRNYCLRVMAEMRDRGYHINMDKYLKYFKCEYRDGFNTNLILNCEIASYGKSMWGTYKLFKNHHNYEYLTICYWNLREKYIRGQKDFTKDIWDKIDKMYKEITNETFICPTKI